MQLKSYMTEDQIRKNCDTLFFTCHPLGKLKMISTIILNESGSLNNIPFETFRHGDVYAMGEIIDAAADEIEFLVEITREQLRELESRVRELEVGA